MDFAPLLAWLVKLNFLHTSHPRTISYRSIIANMKNSVKDRKRYPCIPIGINQFVDHEVKHWWRRRTTFSLPFRHSSSLGISPAYEWMVLSSTWSLDSRIKFSDTVNTDRLDENSLHVDLEQWWRRLNRLSVCWFFIRSAQRMILIRGVTRSLSMWEERIGVCSSLKSKGSVGK